MKLARSVIYAGMAAVLFAGVPAVAQDSGLLSRSPFLPAGAESAPAPVVVAGGPIRLTGILVNGKDTQFVIHDTSTKKSKVVRLNEAGNPFVVKSYQPNANGIDRVTVEYQGRTIPLEIVMPKVGRPGAGAAANPVAAPPSAAAVPAATAAMPAGATLEEWAAEVERRRQLRTPAAPGAPAPPPAPGQ